MLHHLEVLSGECLRTLDEIEGDRGRDEVVKQLKSGLATDLSERGRSDCLIDKRYTTQMNEEGTQEQSLHSKRSTLHSFT